MKRTVIIALSIIVPLLAIGAGIYIYRKTLPAMPTIIQKQTTSQNHEVEAPPTSTNTDSASAASTQSAQTKNDTTDSITGSLATAQRKARDAKRIANIKQIQTALELYYMDNRGYPSAPTPIILGNPEFSCFDETGFHATAMCKNPASLYMAQVPKNPTPGGTPYLYQSTNKNNYSISFLLEVGVGKLKAGKSTASPSGIYQQ